MAIVHSKVDYQRVRPTTLQILIIFLWKWPVFRSHPRFLRVKSPFFWKTEIWVNDFQTKKKSWIEIDQHLARKSPHRNTQHRRTASVLVSGSSATQPAQPVESSERGRCPRLSKIPTRLGKSKTAWWFQWMGLGELAHRKTPYLMGKLMVSCRFSIQSSGGWNPTQSSHLPIGLSQHKNVFFYPPNTPDTKGIKEL